jgi:putative phosphoribosyl transferase
MLARTKQPPGSREEAGRDLAGRLFKFVGLKDVIVLALPNGGVPVGAKVAGILNLPFDILLVGDITVPGAGGPKLGAITCGGVRMLDCSMIDRLHLSDAEVKSAVLQASIELAKKERFFRSHKPSLDVADHTVILVDDGTTACATVRNAVRLLRRQHAERIIVALPVACRHVTCDLRHEACEVVTLSEPVSPATVGKWCKHLPATPDSEVRELLVGARGCAGTHN